MNVCDQVVEKGLCIGCGLCAGVCPRERLRMTFNSQGQYNPSETDVPCGTSCRLCLEVCPFSDHGDDEDALAADRWGGQAGVKHRPAVGYYRGSYAGFSRVGEHRSRGSSGGLATWLLESLLESRDVDRVVCVSPVSDSTRLFDYVACASASQVRRCSRSCYYPVEASRAIRLILREEGRYAITALPCVAKAIRRAQKRVPALRERIRYVLGLVCGQGKSACFAEYVCALGGGDPHRLRGVEFRVKDATRPAGDYGMRFRCADDKGTQREGVVFSRDGMGRLWGDRYFTPNPCNFCDDVFAECADVVFMDAWLPEYSRDSAGHSLVLVRDGTLDGRFRRETDRSEKLSLARIPIDKVIQSQLGVIWTKRPDVRRRIAWASESGTSVPRKRSRLLANGGLLGRDPLILAGWDISRRSGSAWIEVGKDKRLFEDRMRDCREAMDEARRRFARFKRINRLIERVRRFFL